MHGESKEAVAWHTLCAQEAIERLGVDPRFGLSTEEALARRAGAGPADDQARPRRPLWRMALDQFSDFMILVLIAAAAVSALVGEPKDSIAVIVIVLLNAIIGFVQEYRAENALAALNRMAAPHARVRRDGRMQDAPAAGLAVGDIVLLEAGFIVPADVRLIETARLQCAEAALTGESAPVEKDAHALSAPEAPVGDRRGMAYKGATVTNGRGAGVVVAVGGDTEFGRIAGLLKQAEAPKSPLQQRLATFGARLAWAVLAICAVVFAAGIARGEEAGLMLLTAISLAVAAIPEALPAVASIALALGAVRLARQNALVRKLAAVEALGSVTFICTDKTGTLTENRMRVEAVWTPQSEPAPDFYRALALCNDAAATPQGAVGDPTETALLEFAQAHGFEKTDLQRAWPRVDELAFSSARMRMSTLHEGPDGLTSYVKGATEAILPLLADAGGAEAILSQAERMAGEGLRVIAVAQRRFSTRPAQIEAQEEQLEFLGLAGLVDPPRAGVKQAIAECHAAGVIPVMITGDHAGTAAAIARRLGLLADHAAEAVMTGEELRVLPDEALAARVRQVRVYARVDPAQKIRIVEALQAQGEFVAMTGDGVNDAPALKRAEIGVAMGRDGSDVARQAASMILTDDNFATIVRAIREGRRIYDNVRKFIRYTMTSNSGEIWTIFLAPFLGLPIPLLPVHILWINLVTDGLPGLALAGEKAERDVMARPPRPPRESVFAHGMAGYIVRIGLLMAGVCLAVQSWAIANNSSNWRTMVFTVLTLSQLGQCLSVRSEKRLLIEIGAFSNPMMIGAIALTIALQMALIYTPFLQPIFHTAPLSASELGVCLAASCVVLAAAEAEKALRRRRVSGRG